MLERLCYVDILATFWVRWVADFGYFTYSCYL